MFVRLAGSILTLNLMICLCERNVIILSVQSAKTLSSSLSVVGPAIDLAFEEISLMYAPEYRFTLIDMNNSNTKSCTDVDRDGLPFAAKNLGKPRSSKVVTVLFAPGWFTVFYILLNLGNVTTVRSFGLGCSGGVLLLSDLSRGKFSIKLSS